MEWLFLPALLVAVIALLVVTGRRRSRPDASSDAARAHAEAERQKFDWFGNGRR